MPRPARPWFRFYVEALSDRKLRRLTPAQRWLWVAVLGAARQSPLPGYLVVSDRESMDAADLADIAGMPVRDVEKALPLFERSGLIARDTNLDCWWVPKWSGRQYESDNTTERTRKHRSKTDPGNNETASLERSYDDGTGVVGTPPETEADTEQNPPPSPGPSQPAVDNPAGEGSSLVEQAVDLAATRFGRNQVDQGKGHDAVGLKRWWLQQNADGARVRAAALLASHDLTLTQLADALVSGNPAWLNAYRRRNSA